MPARRSTVDYVEDENGCWIWQLSRNSRGYGLKWDREQRRLALAHRWHYEHHRGPIPDGYQVDHLCAMRACVNPARLEAVPPGVNTRRMLDRLGIKRAGPPASRDLSKPPSVNTAECVDWAGCLDRDGYGATWVNGRRVFAHRWIYEQTRGAIPAGMTIDHLCRNRACVNPAHLEAVTPEENRRRAAMRPMCKRGHPWTDENTLWERDGRRKCKACWGATVRRREERLKERGRATTMRADESAGGAG